MPDYVYINKKVQLQQYLNAIFVACLLVSKLFLGQ